MTVDPTIHPYRLGLDLGGTKTEIVALDAVTGAVALRRRVATPSGDYDATIRTLADLVAAAEAQIGATGSVGLGIPGTLSPLTGRVKNANSTWLIGRPLDRDLAAALARPVRLANDADCFALSEATDGAGAGARIVFGMILGTGCGGGIVVDGRLLVGPARTAGEIGHLPQPNRDGRLPDPGACYCGRRGCVEQFLSGPGMAADHRRRTGQALTAEAIAAAAAAGDPDAAATLAIYCDRLAAVLGAIVTLIDPTAIVLGGGLSRIEALYPALADRLPAATFGGEAPTPIRPPRHGDSSGVRGAAWLWGRPEPTASVTAG